MCKPSIAKLYKKVVVNDNATKKELKRQKRAERHNKAKCNKNVIHV